MPERPQPAEAVKVFFSYAHEDAKLCRRLQQHFSFLKREKKIVQWVDKEIKPGQEWRGEIEEHLNSADVILLLISASFANSDFCYNIETGRAMERHNAGEAVVVPIILHPCDWQKASFAKLQALPVGGKAISKWANVEEALYEVARGVREVVEDLIAKRSAGTQTAAVEERITPTAQVPPPPAIDFVPRKDREGNDIVERLRRELTQDPKRLIVLWGVGGVGKTTLAAETVRALSGVFGKRIVWASAEKRADFTYPTLLNEIATQLGEAELTKLATEPKEQAVRRLITAAPTLVVLDNFETVSPDEKQPCADFLATRAQCPALITTREKVSHDAARHIHVDSMDDEEAHKFVERWIGQEAHDENAFNGLDYDEIIRAADARPYVLQWVLAQIDLALEPRAVLDELARAGGEVGERVFTRSFELPQLGDDGRATLLALSLFTPSASRPALAEVAGFGNDHHRLNEAVKRLAALRLIETAPGGQRLTIEGFTRSLAHSRLSADERAAEFRHRYVSYFRRYTKAHIEATLENLDVLEAEKENVLYAMDEASELNDWESMMLIRVSVDNFLFKHGYWDEAIKSGEKAEQAARDTNNEFVISFLTMCVALIHQHRGEYEEARNILEEALETFRKFGSERQIALCLLRLGNIAHAQKDFEEARRLYGESVGIYKKRGDHADVANVLHNLATIARLQGEIEEARRLLSETLEIKKKLGDKYDTADTLHELGSVAFVQGDLVEARRLYGESFELQKRLGDPYGIATCSYSLGLITGMEGNKTEAARLLGEALRIFEKLGSPMAERAREYLASVEGESH